VKSGRRACPTGVKQKVIQAQQEAEGDTSTTRAEGDTSTTEAEGDSTEKQKEIKRSKMRLQRSRSDTEAEGVQTEENNPLWSPWYNLCWEKGRNRSLRL
jgi:transglutaminase/protease-like cytokinesis protein 3